MRAWFALLILLAGCSGNSPSPGPSPVPSPPPGPTRITVAGSITETVSGAAVGSFSAEVDRLPALIPVSAAGFVTRQAWVTAANPTVDLIRESGFDLTFYRQFVRGALDGRMDPIRRWTQAPSIYLQRAGLSDATVSALEQAAKQTVIALTGGRYGVQTWETGDGRRAAQSGWIVIEVYDDLRADCGSSIIGGGEIRINRTPNCVDAGYAATNLAHEIGHSMGFHHVPAGLMQIPAPRGVTAPTDRERHHAAIAYARQPGNRDVDMDATSSTLAPARIIID